MDPNILTDTELHLKQIRLADLNELGKSAMSAAFAGFAEDNRPTSEQVDKHLENMRTRTGFHNQCLDSAHYRRYAGDSTLPRSRYYSIANTEAGDDDGTIVREMRTYYNPRNAGIIQIFDSTLPNDRVILSRFTIPEPSLNIIFLPLAGRPNRFAAEFTDTPTPFLVNLPLRIESRRVKNVVDLRNPITANNFAKALSRLHWNEEVPAFPVRPELNGIEALLPSLLEQSIGGSGLNNIIGIWLRRIGANGIIFPSARVDPCVKVRKNVVQEAQGWNYVDYDGTSATELEIMIHLEESWTEHIRHTPEGPQEPYFYPIPAARIYFEREGDYAGSWYVSGLRKAREALWRFSMAWECLDAFSAAGKDEEVKPVYEWLFGMFIRVFPRHQVSKPELPEQDPDIATKNLELFGANSTALQEALLGLSHPRDKLLEFASFVRCDWPELGKALELLLNRPHNLGG